MSYKTPRRRTSQLAGGRASSMQLDITPENKLQSQTATPTWSAAERGYPSPDSYYYGPEQQEWQQGYRVTDSITHSFGPSINSSYTKIRSLLFVRQAQFVLCILAGIFFFILLLRYGEEILAWIQPLAQQWETSQYGMFMFWILIAVVCNPLLFGHASLSVLGGFIFGIMKGWLLVSTATVTGACFSLLFSRRFAPFLVRRVTSQDPRFKSFSALQYDTLGQVVLARLCLIPHQLVNGAVASLWNVSVYKFAVGTAIATPKLLIHTWIGNRLSIIAMAALGIKTLDTTMKLYCWLSILLAASVGLVTGIYVHRYKLPLARLDRDDGSETL